MPASPIGCRPPRACAAVLLAATTLSATPVLAQMAGVPVLQGAFPRRGLAAAVDAGGADDGSAVGGAVAFGLGADRLLVTAGLGAFRPPESYASTAFTYGARVAFRVMTLADGRLAVTPFAGFGRVELKRDRPAAGQDSKAGAARAPAGVSVGFRHALGARGTLAFFAAPMYAFSRPDDAAESNEGFVRVAAGAEFGFATGFGAIGVTAGLELGQSAPAGTFGPRGSAFGLGLALARGGTR
jgi:hypothetical protein